MLLNFKEFRSGVVSGLVSCTGNCYNQHEIYKPNFSEWKKNVLALVDGKILELSRQPNYNTSSILKYYYLNNNLKDLQAKYITTPTDKATNNVGFIYQRSNTQVLV